jgi:hypothetical protein
VNKEGGREMAYNQPTKPTHELFYIEEYVDKSTGQPRKKRVVWAKGWENQDKFDNNAPYFTFPLGKTGFKLMVKKVRPDKPMQNQGGYQADPRGYQPQQPAPPQPVPQQPVPQQQTVNSNDAQDDDDIPF